MTAQLVTHPYPGNVRELQNVVERAYFSAPRNTITEVSIERTPIPPPSGPDEVQSWFKDMTEGRKDFWSFVYPRYERRDIPRSSVLDLIDPGLRATRGSYKSAAALFGIPSSDYRRFMDFLRRNRCRLDFRPYLKLTPDGSSHPTP